MFTCAVHDQKLFSPSSAAAAAAAAINQKTFNALVPIFGANNPGEISHPLLILATRREDFLWR